MTNNKLYICKHCVKELESEPYTSPFQFRGFFTNFKVPENYLCPKCKNNLYETQVTIDEIETLLSVSHDNKFLESMIDLKEKDPIEYQLKLSQFRTQVEQQNQAKQQTDNKPRCPKCGSTQVTTGARGVNHFWGFIGASKTVNRCGNCGHTWTPKG